MAFQTRTVVVAACDLCGNEQTEDGDTWHFESQTQALDHLTADPTADINGWHQRPDQRLVCWRRDPAHEWAREQDGIVRPGRDAVTVTWAPNAAT